jgi:hypothetical protein
MMFYMFLSEVSRVVPKLLLVANERREVEAAVLIAMVMLVMSNQ